MTPEALAAGIERYLQGTLGPAERGALADAVQRDAGTRETFERQVRMDLRLDALLRPVTAAEARRCASLVVEGAAPNQGSRILRAIGARLGVALPRPGRAAGWRVALAAAAVLGGAVFVGMMFRIWTDDYPLVAGGRSLSRGASLVAPDAPLRIDLGGYCRLDLQPGGALRVEGRPGAEQVRLERGRVACAVDRSVGTFVVRTVAGSARVEGTRFEARLCEGTGPEADRRRLEVAVSDGAVQLSGPFVERLVSAGETASIAPGDDNRLQTTRGYVLRWVCAGPYREAGKEALALFDVAFPPETPGASVDWRPLEAGRRAWDIDLQATFGREEDVAAYLRARLWAPAACGARLEIGSDDAIKVWLNGALVHANNADRAIAPRQDTADVRLRKGWNDLMLKVTNHKGPWGVGCRVCRPDGGDLAGLHVEAR